MSTPIPVYFDARMLGYSGIGTQIEEVLNLLRKEESIFLYCAGDKEKIRSYYPDFEETRIIRYHAPIYSLREQIFFPLFFERKGIFHFPHYNANLMVLPRSVVVIHDLIHLESEEFRKPHYRLYARLLISSIVKKARVIITVSHYTKQKLLEYFPGSKENIHVLYNGINHDYFFPPDKEEVTAFKKKYSLPDEFLLVVGIGKRHKNLDTLLLVLKNLWAKNFPLPLVIGGTNQKLPDYVKPVITEDMIKKIILMPYIPKKEMRLLYGAASALIMPSKLEGFGFPLLEAMACGTPTISSGKTSLPEIGGSASVYFHPESPEEMEHAILRVVTDTSLRKSLIASGLEQAKKFTWQEHVKKLLSIYRQYFASTF